MSDQNDPEQVHHIVPDPDGEPVPAEGTIEPEDLAPADPPMSEEEQDAKLGTIADGDEVPESEEEINQDEAPINPEEEAAAEQTEEE